MIMQTSVQAEKHAHAQKRVHKLGAITVVFVSIVDGVREVRRGKG